MVVLWNIMSLDTNIPQRKEIGTICRSYSYFYQNKTPIPTPPLDQGVMLILQENLFQFNGEKLLAEVWHSHGL